MGFQDRDYNHEPYDDYGYRPKRQRGPMSVTMRLVILNLVLWLVNGLFFSENNLLTGLMSLQAPAIRYPEFWWKFLTYGFAHSPDSPFHIFGNMFCLIMFGYGMMLGMGPGGFALVRGENVEERLGRFEYLAFYLLTIIVGGIVYCLVNWGTPKTALGASGGCVGVIILYALLYPNKMILFFGIIPMPMWLLGFLIVFMDAYGASGRGEQGIAFSVHLAGAAFALFYYFFFLSRRRKITGIFSAIGNLFKRKPKLNIYNGDEPKKKKSAKDVEFERKLDAILDRYGKVGEAGLTDEERKFLKEASRKYKNKN